MGGFGSLCDLLLSEIQLVAPLADMGGDPVLLAQRADRCVLVARLAVLLAALGTALCRLGWPAFLSGLMVAGSALMWASLSK